MNVLFITSSWVSFDSSEPIPFKLGLEFQEIHNLCPWNKTRFDLDKQKLFSVIDTTEKRELWHVVIDDGDIEFVTSPFSYEERPLFQKSIESMKEAGHYLTKRDLANDFELNDLKKTLKEKNHLSSNIVFLKRLGGSLKILRPDEGKAYFSLWAKYMRKTPQHQSDTLEDLKRIWEDNNDSLPNLALTRLFEISTQVVPQTTIPEWIQHIKSFLQKNRNDLFLEETEFYFEKINDLKDKSCAIDLIEKLKFEPQLTLQYPIEFSIPLFLELYGYSNSGPNRPKIFEEIFQSLPKLCTSQVLPHSLEQMPELSKLLINKETGLVFLHNLTLTSVLTPNDIRARLQDIEESRKRGQFDAKRKLHFMSRRPFSEMLEDINFPRNRNFEEFYHEFLKPQNKFQQKFYQNKQAYRLNQAEQYYLENESQDLVFLIDYLTDDFISLLESDEEFKIRIINLLKDGILPTFIIENLKPKAMKYVPSHSKSIRPLEFLPTFYDYSIQSIQHPVNQWEMTFENNEVIMTEKDMIYDSFSPPFPLYFDNSMGRYKRNEEIDLMYGEAIVEIRKIKYALNRSNNKTIFSQECTRDETINLFDFLCEKMNRKELLKNFLQDIVKLSKEIKKKE